MPRWLHPHPRVTTVAGKIATAAPLALSRNQAGEGSSERLRQGQPLPSSALQKWCCDSERSPVQSLRAKRLRSEESPGIPRCARNAEPRLRGVSLTYAREHAAGFARVVRA